MAVSCATGPTFPSPRSWSCNPSATSATDVVEFFRSPFDGTYPVGNLFDHDKPLGSDDPAARVVTLCGLTVKGQVNGHNGYDYAMPEGTVLRAAAGGTVLYAGLEPPSFCPGLNTTVQALLVEIQHAAPDGGVYVSVYGHLSRIDVSDGQVMAESEPIGLSGNTGCSGSPHLHFGVFRRALSGSYVVLDPYGWHATGEDPWEIDARGTRSPWMWRAGAAPPLTR